MNLKFQKKVESNKNFQINITKSTISDNCKHKYTIKPKVYSLQKKTTVIIYNKNKSPLLILTLFLLLSSISIFTSCKSKPKQWYLGGTLHKSNVVDWEKASNENKLATCADFCISIYKDYSLEEIKTIAKNLKVCIDNAVQDHTYSNNDNISNIASICLILMED